MNNNETGFQLIYAVELFYEKQPDIKLSDLIIALGKEGLNVSPISSDENSNLFVFVHNELRIEVEGKTLAPQIVIGKGKPKTDKSEYQPSFVQSKSFNNADSIVNKCDTVFFLSDMFAHSLPYIDRIDIIRKSILAILSVSECKAIHWTHTQQFTDPTEFFNAQSKPGLDWFFSGFINFRVFNIENNPGELVVDTLGLSAIGLSDLQCHFKKLDPNKIIHRLFDISYDLHPVFCTTHN